MSDAGQTALDGLTVDVEGEAVRIRRTSPKRGAGTLADRLAFVVCVALWAWFPRVAAAIPECTFLHVALALASPFLALRCFDRLRYQGRRRVRSDIVIERRGVAGSYRESDGPLARVSVDGVQAASPESLRLRRVTRTWKTSRASGSREELAAVLDGRVYVLQVGGTSERLDAFAARIRALLGEQVVVERATSTDSMDMFL